MFKGRMSHICSHTIDNQWGIFEHIDLEGQSLVPYLSRFVPESSRMIVPILSLHES